MLTTTQRWLISLGLVALLAGLGSAGWFLVQRRPGPKSVLPAAANLPGHSLHPAAARRQVLPPLFPDAGPANCFLLLSGQMYGYLQPCGCARPQLGGLERRSELVKRLQSQGAPVSAADLGDLAPHQTGPQARSKFEAAVRSLATMPYAALTVGPTEFEMPLDEALGAAQNYVPPQVLLGNFKGAEERFPDQFRRWTIHEPCLPSDAAGLISRVLGAALAPGLTMPTISTLATGRLRIGYTALCGDFVSNLARQKDPTLEFISPSAAVPELVAGLTQQGATVRVLLFQGTPAEAQSLHSAFPQAFHLILARADADIAPRLATELAGSDGSSPTLLINVGHKGRSVGLVHVRLEGRAVRLRYQMVELVEDLELPDHETNPAREVMRDYVLSVFQNEYLTKVPRKPHPLQQMPDMAGAVFVGADRCRECHPGAHQVWKNSKHSHAYQALVDYGRPTAELIRRGEVPLKVGRQHDPECAVCHVTGFGYHGGFVDANQTPHLLGNQCENCHGPASLHVANPQDPKYFRPLRLSIGSRETEQKCRSCHDGDNDPHFDLEKYWPKIKHPRY